MLPAHRTKHNAALACRFNRADFTLAQLQDGRANGTTLWLGGQILAYYCAEFLKPKHGKSRAVELGSGVGFTA